MAFDSKETRMKEDAPGQERRSNDEEAAAAGDDDADDDDSDNNICYDYAYRAADHEAAVKKGVARIWPRIITILCVGGLIVAWNGLAWDPATLFPDDAPVPRYIFSFGDSLTTTGFDILSTDYPTLWNPLGNPHFPGNTTSGGPNWVGFMIRDLAPGATMLYNFARYGATINDTLLGPLTPDGHDLRYQVSQFRTHLTPRPQFAPWRGYNSAFVLWMGINDVTLGHALKTVGFDQAKGITDKIINGYIKMIDSLQIGGARNFVLLTVPPVNRNPKFQVGDPATADQIANAVKVFNDKLQRRLDVWTVKHAGSNFRVLDTQPIFRDVIDHPLRYNATDASCASPKGVKCLWTDNFHPGQAIHQAVARKLYESLDDMAFWNPPPRPVAPAAPTKAPALAK